MITLAVLAAGIAGAWQWRDAEEQSEIRNRVWRVGYHNTKPFLFPSASGEGPQGFAFELMEEVARNLKLRFQWVYVPEGADRAFKERKIDLWARSTNVQGLARPPKVTRPWFYNSYGLVVREPAPTRTNWDLDFPLVGARAAPFSLALGKRLLPRSTLQSSPTLAEAIKELCLGKLDAVFADLRDAYMEIHNHPGECLPIQLDEHSLNNYT